MLAWAAVLSFGLGIERSAAGNREHDDGDIWFVHATDPHLFLKAIDEKKDAEGAGKKTRQENLNRQALSDMLKYIRSLPGGGDPSSFLVLTGDLGIDPCEICKNANKPERTLEECLDADPAKQVERTADVLRESPVRDIYLVAGNNDIANESASDEALKYFNKFIDDVQTKLGPDSVKLHNLTRGYLSGEAPATCYADIPHTNYRLIGFPSYSFKARDPGQDRHMKVFRELLDEAKDKKVLIISHTPGMEDPYSLAKARYIDPTPAPGSSPASTQTPEPTATPTATTAATAAMVTPTEAPTSDEKAAAASPADKKKKEAEAKGKKAAVKATTSEIDDETEPKSSKSSASTWKVDEKVLNAWKEAVSSESVVAVFAGHLHDSHKEIYERPYSWSISSEYRAAFPKLYLAPPLAVKNQDKSPIQARGFSLVHLSSDRVESRLFWYDSEASNFTPQPKAKHHRAQRGFWGPLGKRFQTTIRWLWELGDDHNSKSLDRMAVLLIAFLATFLTVVAIWQIPPTDNPLTGEPAKAKPAAEPSPFSGNFAGIIIAGLGGLAATTVIKSFDGKQSAGDKEFYIVWFVISFFVLLIFSAFLRGLVEALRARFAIIYYPLRPPDEWVPRDEPGDQDVPPTKQGDQSGIAPNEGQGVRSKDGGPTRPKRKHWRWPGRFWRWLVYRFHAGLHWLSSLRAPFLTFADTFTNLLQGKNYTITQAFADKIVDQQRNVLRVANTIRKQLHEVIMEKLREPSDENRKGAKGDETKKSKGSNEEQEVCPDDVRVNISVLSLDQNSVFYISRAPGSSRQAFLKRSVAWISVFTGKIRWHKKKYFEAGRSENLILFDNSDKTIGEDHPQIYLKSYYQPRAGADYEAFVVFPVPWPRQRGLEDSNYVKGAIQISFRREEYFCLLWSFACGPNEVREKITKQVDDKIHAATAAERPRLEHSRNADIEAEIKAFTGDPVIDQNKYQSEERMLKDWCTSPKVCATLNTSIKVLGEVLRGFNEHIYNNIAKSEQAD